ncbi:Uncharacterized protein At3g50808 [Olea europaea subsp. europaea]|uniref:Uncharacterized protein At3g50808 n=1 Tax=Olea europaea subsp. europaea TaxID=158383 RepID=A0A8S0Q790_OLEEU|nr:Uncharacterized protein At3g50808 [Olea europaea subsp. europaea]
MSENLASEQSKYINEQHGVQDALWNLQVKYGGLLDEKSILEAELEASRRLRSWIVDKARKSQILDKVLEEAGRRNSRCDRRKNLVVEYLYRSRDEQVKRSLLYSCQRALNIVLASSVMSYCTPSGSAGGEGKYVILVVKANGNGSRSQL